MELEAAQGQMTVLACPRGHAQLSPTCQQPGLHRVPAPAAPAGPPPDLCGCRGFSLLCGPQSSLPRPPNSTTLVSFNTQLQCLLFHEAFLDYPIGRRGPLQSELQ